MFTLEHLSHRCSARSSSRDPISLEKLPFRKKNKKAQSKYSMFMMPNFSAINWLKPESPKLVTREPYLHVTWGNGLWNTLQKMGFPLETLPRQILQDVSVLFTALH